MNEQMTISQAARQFSTEISEIRPLPGGNINQTWLVTAKPGDFVLQRLNRAVFDNPEQCCRNIAQLNQAARHQPARPGWRFPALLPCLSGDSEWWNDEHGELWRAMEFLPGTLTLSHLESPEQANLLGQGLARFHQLCAYLDPADLPATLAHFHDTHFYLTRLFEAAKACPDQPDAQSEELLSFIRQRQHQALELQQAVAQEDLALTVTHGDPKLANFLFDQQSRQPCSLIDLDTLGPGLRLHDLGDCLRSCAASQTEDAGVPPQFDLQTCANFLAGYQQAAPDLLTAAEQGLLARAIWLLPLELGIRFLTDHLQGNRYFHCQHTGQNLERAAGQLALLGSIEEQWPDLARVVDKTFTTPPCA